jgi:hypothetical protein
VLRVSIHAGPLQGISRFNRLDWVDIGYEKLAPAADYKVVLFKIGEGATAPVNLSNYPRWSASLWDLTARAIALTLSTDLKNPQERVPALTKPGKRFAFARSISAVIQHFPNSGVGVRRVGEMEVLQHGSTRGYYQSRVEEDLVPNRTPKEFVFAPKFLRPAELVMRAALVSLTGTHDEVPPRPPMILPKAEVIDGRPQVLIHRIAEPARTGFTRWLYDKNLPPREFEGMPEGIAFESLFLQFLNEAI